MSIIFSREYLPLVVSTYKHPISDLDIHTFLSTSDGDLARKKPYTLIIDARRANNLSAKQRSAIADWITSNREALKEYCAGQAYVVPGVVQRMIIRSVFMISPLPISYLVCSTMEEAWDWCIGQLDGVDAEIEERVRILPEAMKG